MRYYIPIFKLVEYSSLWKVYYVIVNLNYSFLHSFNYIYHIAFEVYVIRCTSSFIHNQPWNTAYHNYNLVMTSNSLSLVLIQDNNSLQVSGIIVINAKFQNLYHISTSLGLMVAQCRFHRKIPIKSKVKLSSAYSIFCTAHRGENTWNGCQKILIVFISPLYKSVIL